MPPVLSFGTGSLVWPTTAILSIGTSTPTVTPTATATPTPTPTATPAPTATPTPLPTPTPPPTLPETAVSFAQSYPELVVAGVGLVFIAILAISYSRRGRHPLS